VITSFCSLLFGFRRTKYIPQFGGFYKKVGDFTWRMSDCEELVGGTYRRRKKKDGNEENE